VYNNESTEELTEDELQEVHSLSDTALDIFRSLFCAMREFRTLEAAKRFLSQLLKSGNLDETAKELGGWCEKLLHARTLNADMTEILHAENVRELHRSLDSLIKPKKRFSSTAFWPLIQRIRITIKDVDILKHVSLVDLPGMQDTNNVRLNASEMMLRECDTIWIVADIARVITNRSVNNLLERYGKDYGIVVICTMIDTKLDDGDDGDLASELGLDRSSKKEYASLKKRVRELDKAMKTSTDKDKQELRLQLEDAEQERWRFLVEARNAHTQRRLEEGKQDLLPSGTKLKVFFVSNTHYASFRGTPLKVNHRLSVQQTGLPALRKFIREQTADAKWRHMENYIDHDCTVFTQSLHIWTGLFSDMDVNKLLSDINTRQDLAQKIIKHLVKGLNLDAITPLRNYLKAEKLVLRKSALEVWDRKQKSNWQTLRAFIRQDGNHQTKKVARESWNEQFFSGIRDFMASCGGEQLLVVLESTSANIEQKLHALLDEILQIVDQHSAGIMLPRTPLSIFLEAEKCGISRQCEEFESATRKNFRNTKLDLIVDRPSAFFAQAMAQTYRECRGQRGTGYKVRVQTIMNSHLSLDDQASPFHQTTERFAEAVKADTQRAAAMLGRKVKNIMEQIHHHCTYMINSKETNPAEEKLKNSLREFLCGNDRGYQHFDDIKADLRRLKRRYKEAK
jgi:hypothetical protein